MQAKAVVSHPTALRRLLAMCVCPIAITLCDDSTDFLAVESSTVVMEWGVAASFHLFNIGRSQRILIHFHSMNM